MVSVAIFDYGAGNIFSLKNSLEQAGASVDVITSFDKSNIYFYSQSNANRQAINLYCC